MALCNKPVSYVHHTQKQQLIPINLQQYLQRRIKPNRHTLWVARTATYADYTAPPRSDEAHNRYIALRIWYVSCLLVRYHKLLRTHFMVFATAINQYVTAVLLTIRYVHMTITRTFTLPSYLATPFCKRALSHFAMPALCPTNYCFVWTTICQDKLSHKPTNCVLQNLL